MKAKCDDFVLKRQAQEARKVNRAKASTSTVVAEHVGGEEPPAQESSDRSPRPEDHHDERAIQQLVLALLAVDEFRDELLQVLANAHVDDGDPAALAQLQELRELPPQKRTERVKEILIGNPLILEDLGRQLMERGPVELGAPVRNP